MLFDELMRTLRNSISIFALALNQSLPFFSMLCKLWRLLHLASSLRNTR